MAHRRFRFRSPPPPAPVDATVVGVVTDDFVLTATPAASDADWARLRRLVAEALILQDAAEELLMSFRDRPDPADVARPCGQLKLRFVELREAMAACGDPEMDCYTAALRQILSHHVLLLKTSLGLLAGAQRSELLDERLDEIEGLGAPARRLEAIRAQIIDRTTRVMWSPAGSAGP